MIPSEAEKLMNRILRDHQKDPRYADKLVGWTVKFSRMERATGRCFYATKQLLVSKTYAFLNTPEHITNTMLHEIAHALTPGHAHDAVWYEQAIALGCDGSRYCRPNAQIIPSKKWHERVHGRY